MAEKEARMRQDGKAASLVLEPEEFLSRCVVLLPHKR